MVVQELLVSEYLKARLFNICVVSDLLATRFFNSVISLVLGVTLLIQSNVFMSMPLYMFLVKILPEVGWGLLFVLHSVVSGCSLMLKIKNNFTLLFDGILGCILWSLFTTAYILGAFASSHSGLFPIEAIPMIHITLMVWWAMVRCWAARKTHKSITVIELLDERGTGTNVDGSHKRRAADAR